MPSSLIFTSLVVLWLLILVPAVARHQQEVARVSGASLAGRVLTRPRRRGEGHPSEEGDSVDDDGAGTVGTRSPEVWVPAARRGGWLTDTAVSVPPQTRGEPETDDDPELENDLVGDLAAALAADLAAAPDADLDPDLDDDLAAALDADEPAGDETSGHELSDHDPSDR